MKMKKFSLSQALLSVAAALTAIAVAAEAVQANAVQARVEGSLLVIAGDNLANQIVVARTGAGDVTVSGQGATRINGRTSVVFPGLNLNLNAVEILLGGGNDVLTLRGLTIANDLFVNAGPGADRILVPADAPIVVGASLTIEGDQGNDIASLAGVAIGGDLRIEGGAGTLTASLTGSMVGFAVTVIGDEANDVVTIMDSLAGDQILIEAKGGADRVTMSDTDAMLISISTDLGADVVSLLGLIIEEDLGVFTGPGNDTVTMTDISSNKNITVSLDSESDRVTGTNVSAAFDAVFEGGAGTDTLQDFGIVGGVKKEIKEFEVVLP